MKYVGMCLAAASFVLSATSADASPVSPLETGDWYQVARIADNGGGMFDGDGDLRPDYSYGTFTSVDQDTDFARPFDVYEGMQILFITGDASVWGKTDYDTLRGLIDARTGNFNPNIAFESVIGPVIGNVLSRPGAVEDPWIGLQGTHSAAIYNGIILWGENNWSGGLHTAAANGRGGINVYVSLSPVPLPAGLVFLGGGLMLLAGLRRAIGRNRRANA